MHKSVDRGAQEIDHPAKETQIWNTTSSVAEAQPIRFGLWAFLLLSVFAWVPAMYPGYWQCLDGFVPVFNAAQPGQIASIATFSDLWRGMGSATFLLTQPLLFLDVSPVTAVRITFVCAFILGGLGIYLWLQPRLNDRAAGLAGLIYILLPPILATVYVRGNLSDALILALLPIALAGISSYATSQAPSAAIVIMIALVWMWRTQAGLAALATILLLLYTLLVERHKLALFVVLISGATGFATILPLWSYQAEIPVQFGDHFIYLFQFFGNSWGVAPSIAGWQDGYPFQLGFVAVGFSLVAIWLWTQTHLVYIHFTRLMLFSIFAVVLLSSCCLVWSQTLWEISGTERLLTYPWQIVLLAMPFLAMIASTLPVLHPSFHGLTHWGVLVILVILGSYPYLNTDFTQIEPPERPVAVIGADNNTVVLSATLHEDRLNSEAYLEITWQTLQPLDFDYNLFFQALVDENGMPKVISQLDTQPLQGKRPATTWQAGEILQDTYRLDMSSIWSQPDGNDELFYFFGYYDWRDGVRLPINGGIDDKLVFYGK